MDLNDNDLVLSILMEHFFQQWIYTSMWRMEPMVGVEKNNRYRQLPTNCQRSIVKLKYVPICIKNETIPVVVVFGMDKHFLFGSHIIIISRIWIQKLDSTLINNYEQ